MLLYLGKLRRFCVQLSCIDRVGGGGGGSGISIHIMQKERLKGQVDVPYRYFIVIVSVVLCVI